MDIKYLGHSAFEIETTGKKILIDPFLVCVPNYKPENIYVYEGKIYLENVFFTHEYKEVNKEVYEKYSLRSWLKEILED